MGAGLLEFLRMLTELQEKEFFGTTLFHPGIAVECTAGVS